MNVARYVVDSLLLLSYAFVFINTGDQNDLTYSASCHFFLFFSHFAHCSVIFMYRRCVIEVDDVIPTRYTLTVGTFRNFYNRFHDFHNFINRTINCHAFFFLNNFSSTKSFGALRPAGDFDVKQQMLLCYSHCVLLLKIRALNFSLAI